MLLYFFKDTFRKFFARKNGSNVNRVKYQDKNPKPGGHRKNPLEKIIVDSQIFPIHIFSKIYLLQMH